MCTVPRSRLVLFVALLCVVSICALGGITTFGEIPNMPIANLTRTDGYRWVVPVYASLSAVALVTFVAAASLCLCVQRGGADVHTPLMTMTDE